MQKRQHVAKQQQSSMSVVFIVMLRNTLNVGLGADAIEHTA
jgi:hypothetical protein